MKKLLHSQKGQSFVELVMVVFLFMMFVTGIVQIIMLGNGLIKCEIAARRAAWNISLYNNLGMNNGKERVGAILGSTDVKTDQKGSKENGRITTVHYKVPAIGFFHLVKPNGFDITATNAVISYTEEPFVAGIVTKGFDAVLEAFKKQ